MVLCVSPHRLHRVAYSPNDPTMHLIGCKSPSSSPPPETQDQKPSSSCPTPPSARWNPLFDKQNNPPTLPAHNHDRINRKVRSTPLFNSPNFDFAGHRQSRSYTVHDYDLCYDPADPSCGVAFLDAGVAGLLPRVLEPPHECALSDHEEMFTVAPAQQGMGLGLFAVRDLGVGETVLVERPIVVLPYIIGVVEREKLGEVYEDLIGRLGEREQAVLKNFASPCLTEDGKMEDWAERVLNTHAIAIQLEVPTQGVAQPELRLHRAIFSELSRCNHSCSPNAGWTWDTDTFSIYLFPVRPITRGEEITIQYIPTTSPWRLRRSTLLSLYNFTCRCSACTAPSPTSDASRVFLSSFWSTVPTLEEWFVEPSIPDDFLIQSHLKALEVIRQERLEVLGMGEHIDTVAMCFGGLENVEMFRLWIDAVRRAKTLGRRGALKKDNDDEGNPDETYERWWINPPRFPLWGLRKSG